MPRLAAEKLPAGLLARGSLRGSEYAWPAGEIPRVIEAARQAGLINIGGQLQFRLPDGGTCECYWVEVDTYKSVDEGLPWRERVDLTAEAALRDFEELQSRFDFVSEGRLQFAALLDALAAEGKDPADCACFVWYVASEADA